MLPLDSNSPLDRWLAEQARELRHKAWLWHQDRLPIATSKIGSLHAWPFRSSWGGFCLAGQTPFPIIMLNGPSLGLVSCTVPSDPAIISQTKRLLCHELCHADGRSFEGGARRQSHGPAFVGRCRLAAVAWKLPAPGPLVTPCVWPFIRTPRPKSIVSPPRHRPNRPLAALERRLGSVLDRLAFDRIPPSDRKRLEKQEADIRRAIDAYLARISFGTSPKQESMK